MHFIILKWFLKITSFLLIVFYFFTDEQGFQMFPLTVCFEWNAWLSVGMTVSVTVEHKKLLRRRPPWSFKVRNDRLFSDIQQPRSCRKTSLRVDPAPVEELAAAWTCRKLHRKAEVASAVGAGTNTASVSNQSCSFDQPDQLLPKPCSDQLPYEQHSTNKLLANEWPVNCQTPRSMVPTDDQQSKKLIL